MKWSFRLGRFAGIDVDIHVTFIFLLVWIAIVEYQRGGAGGAIDGVVFILAVFASVVLHEYGHALTARRYGVRTRNITILPIGGVASLERIPSEPKQELVIAIAGPVVTVAIAAVLYVALLLSGQSVTPVDLDVPGANFVNRLMWVNVALALFNLLPAFPMDGGRVLRAGLALRLDYVKATSVAASIGRLFAILFGIAGFFSNPFLLFIALFVWMGATGESWSVQLQSALRGLPVERVMIRDLRTLSPDDTLARAVDHLLAGFQQDFPVVEGDRLVGVLPRTDLVKALSAHGASAPVRVAMRSDYETAHPEEPLEEAFTRMQRCKCHTMPVLRESTLAGVLTMDNVGEFFMVHGATKSR
jgi:Zn-dependent protease/CBS domain-containing protein